MTKKILLIVIGVALLAAGLGYYNGYDIGYEKAQINNINGFDECGAAGYPIRESHPATCALPNGKTFTEPTE